MQKIKRRIFDIIQIGNKKDIISRLFDYFIVLVIALNLFVTLFYTFDESEPYLYILEKVEFVTIIIFLLEYALRLWTADMLYPNKNRALAIIKFIFSLYGLIDLLSFLPFFLPLSFPGGIVAFRILRVIRIFRLFKINSQYDAFNVITNVLKEKRNQLFSSIVLILIFLVATSLTMYSVEHEVQPENFKNAFSGLWWSVSTLLTVGYGDIYPITTLGQILAIVMAFLGVGLVAIPTGIISAGFVEHYTKIKTTEKIAEEHELKFMTSVVSEKHDWNKKAVKDIVFPPQFIMVSINRGGETIVPNGLTVLQENDILVFAAKNYKDEDNLSLREIKVKEENEWVGRQVKNLDISRRELIVMIRRKNKTIIPNGETYIEVGDTVIIYSERHNNDAKRT